MMSNYEFHGDEQYAQDDIDYRRYEQYDYEQDYLYELYKDEQYGFTND